MNSEQKDTILIVDDIETNREILEAILQDTYHTVSVASGISAISEMFSGVVLPSIVLLDIMMPEMDGYAVLEMMKKSPLTEHIPVIFITAADATSNETRGLGLGAVDYISKPFNPEIVKARIATHLRLYHYSVSLERMVREKVDELIRSKEKMLETMANIIEYRNLESGSHVKRTSDLTRIMAECLCANPKLNHHVSRSEVDIMANAAPLHDVGKVAIADDILLKPGKLTTEEFEIIKTHTTIGGEIIKSMMDENEDKYLKFCQEIATCHHERWDGKGYPNGVSGEDIPLVARIVAVVDVYDALVSERVYKSAMTHEQAIEILNEGSGTQFDPVMIEALNQIENKFKEYSAIHK